MTLLIENIRKLMGWCPNVNRDTGIDPLSFNYSNSFSQRNETIQSTSLPLFYQNIYAGGLVKETVIGVISILAIIFLSSGEGNNSFIHKYEIQLVLLSFVLTQFALSRSNIEINDKFIKVRTLFHWIAGSTTHSLDSINTIHVEKNIKLNKSLSGVFFILGLSYILLLLTHLFAGKTVGELTPSIVGIIFCFGWSYIMYIASKSDYYIRISFNPHPSINNLNIYSKEARDIAALLKEASCDSGNGAVGDDT
jgi:hypothetical protein